MIKYLGLLGVRRDDEMAGKMAIKLPDKLEQYGSFSK
ncbi:MAG: hypothetical protein ACJAS6_001168 [Rickettsiales bacterium]|jgi:hypothetical protein